MNLQEIVKELELTCLTQPQDLSVVVPTSGYASDLLSCVMAGAKKDGLWITLQAHLNIIAVAALLELSAIIVTENAPVEQPVIEKANDQGVILLATPLPTYAVVGKLWEMGLHGV